MRTYLDFEKPVAEIENKIEELAALAEASGADAISQGVELSRLKSKAESQLAAIYAKLDPWQKTQVARHQDRPRFRDYVAALVTDFVELSGDRSYGEDAAILGGTGKFLGRPVLVMGHEKGRTTADRLKHNFGMARPEGYRKAVRLMDLAEKFSLPVVSFVDTAGAYPGIGAEERGQAGAIARNILEMFDLKVPIVVVVIGEGGSGGALGIGIGDRVGILENAYYSVISPEGCAAILWKSGEKAPEAAEALNLTSADLLRLGLVDKVIPEPLGGAHRDVPGTVQTVRAQILAWLQELAAIPIPQLLEQRLAKFRGMGMPVRA